MSVSIINMTLFVSIMNMNRCLWASSTWIAVCEQHLYEPKDLKSRQSLYLPCCRRPYCRKISHLLIKWVSNFESAGFVMVQDSWWCPLQRMLMIVRAICKKDMMRGEELERAHSLALVVQKKSLLWWNRLQHATLDNELWRVYSLGSCPCSCEESSGCCTWPCRPERPSSLISNCRQHRRDASIFPDWQTYKHKVREPDESDHINLQNTPHTDISPSNDSLTPKKSDVGTQQKCRQQGWLTNKTIDQPVLERQECLLSVHKRKRIQTTQNCSNDQHPIHAGRISTRPR